MAGVTGPATTGRAARAALPVRAPFFYGWIVLAVAIVGMFASAPGQASILTVFVEPIGRETGWSRSVVSGALSIATLVTALAMPVTGYLFDRIGARLTLAGAGLLLGAGCLAMSRVTSELTLYLGVTSVRLLGLGVLYLTSTTLVARWFVRRRGRAMAAAVIGMAVGMATFPPLLQRVSEAAGWRAAWVVLAVVVWALVIVPSLLFVRNRPEDVGLFPDGDHAGPVGPDPAAPARPATAEVSWRLSEAVRQRTFWLLVLATAVPFVVNVAVAFNQMPVLIDNGLSAREAALTVSLYAICFSVGSLIAGWLADRLSVRFALIVSLIVLTLAVVLLINARTVAV
ncbi:MAG TPA: MFS transporter, partial [Dehalococcoidia bacterium]|nr:MFS transporter [Dehalococcoidia bacterium]